jgi:hypothetical protein
MTDAVKPFWERELETLDGELDDAPISSQWRNQLGEHGLAEEPKTIGGNPLTNRLQSIAARVSRPANVVRNTEDGEERTLYVAFSDGTKTNDPKDTTIYLSPDAVLAQKKGVDEDIVVDAMTGQVLLAGTMKRTVSPKAWSDAAADSVNKPATTIWRAFETAIARQDVLKNWPGCADYFKRHAEQTAASKEQVQNAIDELRPSPELAAAAMAWNIQYPANKLALPPKYQRAVDKAVSYLNRKHRPFERYQMCADVAHMLAEALAEPPPPPPPAPKPTEDKGERTGDTGEPEGEGDPTTGEPTDKTKTTEPKPEPKDKDAEPETADESTKQPEAESSESKEPEAKETEEPEPVERDSPEPSGAEEPEETEAEEPEAGGDGKPTDPAEPANEDGAGDTGEAEEPEPEGGERSDAGIEGDAESDESGGAAPEPGPDPDDAKPEGPAPDVTDGGLFGEKLDNERAPAPFLPEKMEVDGGAGKGGGEAEIRPPDELVKHKCTSIYFIEESNPASYAEMVRSMQPQVNAIQAAMRFRNNDRSHFNRGCTSGDLDEGSLHKLVLNEDNPAIWERRELIGQPKVAVGLLIDESGSMNCSKFSKSYIQMAKEVAIAMAAALEKIKGVSLMVLGHSGPDSAEFAGGTKAVKFTKEVKIKREKWSNEQLDMYEYFTINHKNPWSIVHAQARGGNYDSFAMDYSVRKMIKDYQAFERKLLFVISDGEPSSSDYGSDPAMKHMRQVCEWGRQRDVLVYGIGIANAYSIPEGVMMYGKGNFVILKDVMSSLTILTAFLRQVSTRQ